MSSYAQSNLRIEMLKQKYKEANTSKEEGKEAKTTQATHTTKKQETPLLLNNISTPDTTKTITSTEQVDSADENPGSKTEGYFENSNTVVFDLNESKRTKWVSEELRGEKHNELWNVDLYEKDGLYALRLNDDSYISRQPIFRNTESNTAFGKELENGNVRFLFPQNNLKTRVTETEDGKDTTIYCKPYNVFTIRNKQHSKISVVFSVIYVDTAKYSSFSNIEEEFTLYRAPLDYNGFQYIPISDEMKAGNKNLKEMLLNMSERSNKDNITNIDLACMYAYGLGTARNSNMAFSKLLEAEKNGAIYATLNLATLCREGYGPEGIDIEQAQKYYEKAFANGYVDALVFCGDMLLETGGTIPANIEKAKEFYQKAFFKTSPLAYLRLSKMYQTGIGGEQNPERALEYLDYACEKGLPEAYTEKATWYLDGNHVVQNLTEAHTLLNKAVTAGNAQAMKILASLYLKGIGVQPDFNKYIELLHKAFKTEEKHISPFCSIGDKVKKILNAE